VTCPAVSACGWGRHPRHMSGYLTPRARIYRGVAGGSLIVCCTALLLSLIIGVTLLDVVAIVALGITILATGLFAWEGFRGRRK
jgi:hypothetical protein